MFFGSTLKQQLGLCSLVIFSLLAFSLKAAEPNEPTASFPSPVTAEESLSHLQLHPGLRIELVAAEPQVIDPVAIRFDEQDRMWVVEMIDYPNGPKPGEPPLSRIKILEDKNNDGRYETSHVFADKLLFVTGLQPWKGGVIVTMAGKVAYMKDTNGDGSTDINQTWFTGFSELNSQLRANHPTFALDNQIYIANGLRGGDVIARREEWSQNVKAISISGMDFRFDPKTGTYETVSGNGQFGLTFDDFGNRFVCSNRNPCKHIVLEDRYIKRNPHLAVRSVFHDVSADGADSRIFPISRIWTTSTLHEGQFTAACGVTIYRGDALPEDFQGNSFTCDPTGNLVHRDVLSPQGATFNSRPGREGVEFLATKDEWFRPVNLANGPDGALYVVDMYRAVIEHPQWVPDELKNRPDERYGDDKGRIYRIVPETKKTGSSTAVGHTKLSGLSARELVKLLEHSNSWQRETAARLIFERQDVSVGNQLQSLVRKGNTPQARVHALWALEGLEILTVELLTEALSDSHPRVSEQAVRLAERYLNKNHSLRDRVRKLAEHADARVRFQVALSLGESSEVGEKERSSIVDTIAAIAFQSADDPWTRVAAASAVADDPVQFLESCFLRILINNKYRKPGMLELISESAEMIGSRRSAEEIQTALFPLRDVAGLPDTSEQENLSMQLALFEGLGRGLNRRGKSLRSYVASLPDPLKEEIVSRFKTTLTVAGSAKEEIPLRLKAISVLRNSDYELVGKPLLKLAADGSNRTLQLAAIDTLSKFHAAEIGKALLTDFTSQTPAVRRAILDALLTDENRTQLLLDQIEAKQVAIAELDPGRTNRLTRHRNKVIQKRAKKLLAAAVPEDRKKVLATYQPALSLKTDPMQGLLVFQKNCTACHRIGTLGVNVAPDLADSRSKTPSYLLTSILDPNRAIDNNYFSYTVVTTGGKVITGIISAETATSVTLRQQENKTETILREDIDEIRSNGVSLMPVGLEKNITVQQMADLISYIKNWRYLNGRVPIDVGRE
jgi:putative membrane-bound dehydrogenase-like protein